MFENEILQPVQVQLLVNFIRAENPTIYGKRLHTFFKEMAGESPNV
jgi:hypothetical protein